MDLGLPSSLTSAPSRTLPTSWQRQKHISQIPPVTVLVSLKLPGGIRGAFATFVSALATTLLSGTEAAAMDAVLRKFLLVRFIAVYSLLSGTFGYDTL